MSRCRFPACGPSRPAAWRRPGARRPSRCATCACRPWAHRRRRGCRASRAGATATAAATPRPLLRRSAAALRRSHRPRCRLQQVRWRLAARRPALRPLRQPPLQVAAAARGQPTAPSASARPGAGNRRRTGAAGGEFLLRHRRTAPARLRGHGHGRHRANASRRVRAREPAPRGRHSPPWPSCPPANGPRPRCFPAPRGVHSPAPTQPTR